MFTITIYFPGGDCEIIKGKILKTHIHGAILIEKSNTKQTILYPVTSIFKLTITED